MQRLLSVVLLVFFVAHPGWSQQQPEPARMSFTIGAGYDQGDFGTTELSQALYFPLSFRYTGDRRRCAHRHHHHATRRNPYACLHAGRDRRDGQGDEAGKRSGDGR